MSRGTDGGRCPYCGRLQPPAHERLWRCPGCNLFVCAAELRDPGREEALDDVSHDLCPWCAYPLARELSLPEHEEFRCAGCAGTLTADMLETQAAINAYRKRSLSGRGYLVFVLVLIASLFLLIRLLT